MTDFSKTDIRALVQDLYKRLTEGNPYEPESFTNGNPESWYAEQEEHDANYIEDCQQEILQNTYSEKTKAAARKELEQIGVSPDSLDNATFLAVCNGVTRAEIEKTKHITFLRRDPIIPYKPTDELFASAQSSSDLQSIAKPQPPAQKPKLSVAQAAEMYVKFKVDVEASWPAANAKSRRRGIDWFSVLVGQEKDIEAVTFKDFRKYRDLLYKLKKNTPAKVNISEYQSEDDGTHIDPKTVKTYFTTVKAFLVWLAAEGYSSKSLVGSIQLSIKPKAPKNRALAPETLEKFLKSPLFSGCAAPKKRHLPGSKQIKDDYFWIPLLGLYTGARMAELLQLKPSDFHFSPQLSYFEISPESQLKNKQSARKVPIHKDLELWGIKEFVEARQAHARVFYRISLDTEKASSPYSKAFGRYLNRTGLKTDTSVFHSFRHTFIDATRDADIPESKSKMIVGHKNSSVHAGYGSGASIENLYAQIQKVDFKLPSDIRNVLSGKT